MWTATVHRQSCEKVNVDEPTCMFPLRSFICLRTSSNFLICNGTSGLFVVVLAKEPQQTAKRQKTTNFIFSVWAPDHQKKLFEFRFTGNADSCVAYLFIHIPEDLGKPLAENWKSCRNCCVWVMTFSFPLAVTTTWFDSGVKPRLRGAYRCKCVNVKLFECTRQEATGRRHFPFSFWISGAAAILCHR